jgi:MFS transporter, ACS family, D-galactonate transporter
MTETPRSSWRIVPLLMGLSFFGHFNRVSISVAGSEHLIPDLGISPERMGVVYSAFLIGYTLFQTPAGIFADRFGIWITLGLMVTASAVFTALTGVLGLTLAAAGQLWLALLIVRSLMGACNSPLHPSSARAVSRWIPQPSQGLANGLALGAALLGIASTYIVFGRLSDRFGWPGAFMFSSGATLVVAVCWWLLAGDAPGTRRLRTASGASSTAGSWIRLIKNRDLLRVTAAYAALDYFEYLFFYWMQYYFGDVLKLGSDTARLYSTITMLAMAAGMMSGGWLTDRCVRRMGRRKGRAFVPVVGMSLGAILLVVGVLAKDPHWVVVWFSFALAAGVAAEAACWMTAVELGGEQGTTAAGLLNTGGNLGGIIAPVVTPWVGVHFGWFWSVGLGAAVSLTGALLWLRVRPTPEPT